MKDLIHEILNDHLVIIFSKENTMKVIKQEDLGNISQEIVDKLFVESKEYRDTL